MFMTYLLWHPWEPRFKSGFHNSFWDYVVPDRLPWMTLELYKLIWEQVLANSFSGTNKSKIICSVCAQAGLFSAKPVPKKWENYTFYVWRAVWCLQNGREWQIFSSNKSSPANSMKGFYTSTLILFSSRYLLSAKSICPIWKQTIYSSMQICAAAPPNRKTQHIFV